MNWHNIKSELIPVSVCWALGAGLGQLILLPFIPLNFSLWFGMTWGAVWQAAHYIRTNRLKDIV